MNPVTALSLARIGLGGVALAAPELAGRLFRLDVQTNPQLPYMTRMFASREIALGTATLFSRGRSRALLTALGAGVDSADAYAGYQAGGVGAVSRSTSGFLTAPAVAAVAAGVLGLAGGRRRPATAD